MVSGISNALLTDMVVDYEKPALLAQLLPTLSLRKTYYLVILNLQC